MRLYNTGQLVVILIITFALFLFSVSRTVLKKSEDRAEFVERKEYVYEIRGSVRQGGFYCFSEAQTLGQLLSACNGLKDRVVFTGNTSVKVPAGSRVEFGENARIDDMDARARLNFFLPVSVNACSARDLEIIQGVGAKTAQAIVDYRNKNGPVKNLRELTAVKGLGEKKLMNLKPYLTVGH